MTDLYCEPMATKLEDGRAIARQNGRLSYDCQNCVVFMADRVQCKKEHMLGNTKNGSYFLPAIIRGTKLSVCQKCPDYESSR